MCYDLEAELLRAARALCAEHDADQFTVEALRKVITGAPQRFPRLAHPFLSHLIGSLADRLVVDGVLGRRDAGYVWTERARAYLSRSPRYLLAPETADRDGGERLALARVDAAAPANLAIARFRWGEIVDSTGRAFRDARLFPGGVEEWDWRRTGTRHDPGIQIADFEDLLATRPDVVLLSRGVNLALQVPQPTIDFARGHAAAVLVLQSEHAVAEYNLRIARERVVALVHSTC